MGLAPEVQDRGTEPRCDRCGALHDCSQEQRDQALNAEATREAQFCAYLAGWRKREEFAGIPARGGAKEQFERWTKVEAAIRDCAQQMSKEFDAVSGTSDLRDAKPGDIPEARIVNGKIQYYNSATGDPIAPPEPNKLSNKPLSNYCDELGCMSSVSNVDDPLPKGWTRTVVSGYSPESPSRVSLRLRCPAHPLPPGGIVTMGGKQVSPPPQTSSPMPDPVSDPSAYEDALREDRQKEWFRKRIALERGETITAGTPAVKAPATSQATPLTREQVEACRRIGRDEVNRTTTIGLAELDALCDTALLGIGAIERLSVTIANARNQAIHVLLRGERWDAQGVEPDPDRPCEKEHPELEKLCGALRSLGVPCDGFTPTADAIGALRAARDRVEELAAFVARLDTREPGPHVPSGQDGCFHRIDLTTKKAK
jgi:hypothetical protein